MRPFGKNISRFEEKTGRNYSDVTNVALSRAISVRNRTNVLLTSVYMALMSVGIPGSPALQSFAIGSIQQLAGADNELFIAHVLFSQSAIPSEPQHMN